MDRYRFYKNSSNQWFIDIPEWGGDLSELEMVSGADSLLDIISQGDFEVSLYISESPFNGSDVLNLIEVCDDSNGGAIYSLKQLNNIQLNLEIWLCEVTKQIFNNYYPPNIYFTKTWKI